MRSDNHSHPVSTRVLGVLLTLAAGLLAQGPLHAGASPPPGPNGSNARWNATSSLKPAAILGDSTHFTGAKDPKNGDTLLWHGLDIETDATGSYIFTATGQGLQIYRATNPAAAEPLGYIYGWISDSAFPSWNYSDKDWYIKQVDAPEGFTNLAALTMEEQGFAIVRTDAKNAPIVAYQRLVDTTKVHAFTVGQTHFAYASNFSNGKVYLFNMSAAAGMNRCLETPPSAACPGVYGGEVLALSNVSSLDGTGRFLSTTKSGSTAGNLKIWDLSVPAAPVPLVEISGSTKTAALWKLGSSYYVAKLDLGGRQLTIYDVSCIASGVCTGAPQVFTVALSSAMNYVTASIDAGKAYLYVGADDLGTCVAQREFIYDVSNPSSPSELTPKIHPDGYWGWYYMGCPTGFSLVGPRIGKVHGGHLFRAALTVLDSHTVSVSGPPTADFSWSPAVVYPGTPVQFTDQSSGAPTEWSWSFQDGTPASFNDQTPTAVTFGSQGAKQISLNATKDGQGVPVAKTLTVLDPVPHLAGVSVSPANPIVCQPVTLSAVGPVTGAPTLQYEWKVENAAGTPVFTQTNTQTSQAWSTSLPVAAAGGYTARLTVSNGAGSDVETAPFTLLAPPALPGAGLFTPTTDPFTAGTVTFHANAPGATEWNWDFDGDGVFQESDWTNDPVFGPNPTHRYTSKGERQVRVKVRNCLDLLGVLSAPVTVDIQQITPLKANFTATGSSCNSSFCIVDTSQTISFADASTGADVYEYDWDGNGVDQTSPTAITSHRFSVAGTYVPKLTVRRGTEADTATHGFSIIVAAANPPTITIIGATSAAPNAPISLTASATSCSPAAAWTWTASGGGTVTGTSNAVTVSFSSTGTKTVTASNSACGNASDSHSITITSTTPPPPPPPPPPGLTASYTVSAVPTAGQPVTFNGSGSSGSPTLYAWTWGDGSPATVSAATTATHTFAAAGTYSVELEVSKAGSCPLGICSATKVLTVTVVAGGPPPPVARFTSSAECTSSFGLVVCDAQAGDEITFTDTSTGTVESRAWNFGDGGTATGAVATHTFASAGNFTVSLTASGASKTSEYSLPFNISAAPDPKFALLLPFFAWSQGTLVQVSDFYAFNPGDEPLVLKVYFYKRGTPDPAALPKELTLAPHSARFVQDALGSGLFNLPNPIIGFLYFTWDGAVEPSVNGVNRTFASDGTSFGQSYPAVRVPRLPGNLAKATVGDTLHVIGLNDNAAKSSSVGIANPFPETAKVELSFFDRAGNALSARVEQTVSGYGQKIFQAKDLQLLGAVGDDFRVEMKVLSGGPVFPFGSVLRKGSQDQSYLAADNGGQQRAHLLGVLNTGGVAGSEWRTDALLFNPGGAALTVNAVFTPIGLTSVPAPTKVINLAPFESRRLADIIDTLWGVRSIGVLSFSSAGVGGVYPVIVGERYEISNAAKIFGQASAPQDDADAAAAGDSVALIGLRQDTAHRSTLFFYNPGAELMEATLIYRAGDGHELARSALALGSGVARQISPQALPAEVLAAGGAFTVEAQVTSGKLLAVGQVVTNATNDPAQITGIVF